MAAEYGIAEYGTHARDGTAVAVQLLAAGLVLGPRAVPDAIGRCRDLLSARVPPGQDGDLRDALAILLAMSGRYESARDALAVRSGPGAAAGSGGRVAAAAVEHLAGRWNAVRAGPAGRPGPASRQSLRLPVFRPVVLTCWPARCWRRDGSTRRTTCCVAAVPARSGPARWAGHAGLAMLGLAMLGDRCGIAARVLAARGRAACALLLAHSAVATAERTDSTGGQGLASLDLAHTYLALGDGRAARAAAMNARRSFVRKEHLVGIARADQLLSATNG